MFDSFFTRRRGFRSSIKIERFIMGLFETSFGSQVKRGRWNIVGSRNIPE
jgi:hypothetical protein